MDSRDDDVVRITRDLIRIDTSNYGPSPDTVGEAEAAEYCSALLSEVGLSPEVIRTSSDMRRAVTARIPGRDRTRGALVVHGHLDVVPAIASEWSHPPFAAEVADGYIWGRGAVDMKNMDAMILAVVRQWQRESFVPPRDVILCFFPDEEAGMVHGSSWMVEHRRDVFDGATEAIGEVGGFSLTIRDDLRLYPIQTAEKGIRWLLLRAARRAGHGSMLHADNAVTEIAHAVARVGSHTWPIRHTATTDRFLSELSAAFGVAIDDDECSALLERIGTLGLLVGATMRNTANPTMLDAGYKVNVVPREATAAIDGRFVPGFESEFDATIRALVGDEVDIEVLNSDIAIEAPLDSTIIEVMASAIRESDPNGHVVPYMISGGTDAKALSRLGINCYGFSPLRMPPELDYWRLFHGVDERVPIDGLTFGVRVLDSFLRAS